MNKAFFFQIMVKKGCQAVPGLLHSLETWQLELGKTKTRDTHYPAGSIFTASNTQNPQKCLYIKAVYKLRETLKHRIIFSQWLWPHVRHTRSVQNIWRRWWTLLWPYADLMSNEWTCDFWGSISGLWSHPLITKHCYVRQRLTWSETEHHLVV